MRVYLAFGKYCYLLWQILYTIGQFFMVVNGNIIKIEKSYLVTLQTRYKIRVTTA